MKERLYLSPDLRTVVEVCDCEGQLQVRFYNAEHSEYGYSRLKLNRADLDRLADFFNDLLVDVEDLETKQADPTQWEALPEKEREK